MRSSPRHRHRFSGSSRPLGQEVYHLLLSHPLHGTEACLHVLASSSLAELHQVILAALAQPPCDVFQFRLFTQNPPLLFNPPEAQRALLGGLGLSPATTIQYGCSLPLGDFDLLIEVTEITDADPAVTYPYEEFWEISAEDEDEDEEEEAIIPLDADLESMASLLQDGLDRPEGLGPWPFEEQLSTAMRLLELTAPRPLQFEALSEQMGEPLEDWVDELLAELLEQKRHQEALDLIDRMTKLPELFPEYRPFRMESLVHLNRPEEALALFDEMSADEDEERRASNLATCLEPLMLLGRGAQAEQLAHQLRQEPDLDVQYLALSCLIKRYKATGRRREARNFERSLEKIARAIHEEEEEERREDLLMVSRQQDPGTTPDNPPAPLPPAPVQSAHLKVGRNDTCPCGSGKKYKKCCGA
jgi:pentatricopeptide repeat protein